MTGEPICDDCGLPTDMLWQDSADSPLFPKARCDVCYRVWRREKRLIEMNPFYVTDLNDLLGAPSDTGREREHGQG